MLNRNLLKYLTEWHQSKGRKPLVLRGARQVGKTTLVNMFSKQFKHYICLNLETAEDKNLFEKIEGFENSVNAIFFQKNVPKDYKNTLLFIDEIQNSQIAVNYLRYFHEKIPDLPVIAAGSLLETLLHENLSFPVGRVEFLVIRPFSFSEFLTALGERSAIEAINTVPFPEFAHDKLTSLFKIYSLIGGMPEAVNSYLETNDFVKVKKILFNLFLSYKEDVEKYASNSSQRALLRHLIDNVFFHPSERITFSGFGNSNYRSREVSEAFRLLEKTMLLQLNYPTTGVNLPILPDRKKSPKLQLLDTGLVNFLSGIDSEVVQSENLLDVFKGRIGEHIVGQELLVQRTLPEDSLNFWVREKRQSSAEIDFILSHGGKIIPVEVKAGKEGKLRSLNQFISLSPISTAVRIYNQKFNITTVTTSDQKDFRLINLPFYLVSKIDEYIRISAGD